MQRWIWIGLAVLVLVGLALRSSSDEPRTQQTDERATDDRPGGGLVGSKRVASVDERAAPKDAAPADEVDTDTPSQGWFVSGTVSKDGGRDGLPNARVRVWRIDRAPPHLIGEGLTDAEGAFTLRVRALERLSALERARSKLYLLADAPGYGSLGHPGMLSSDAAFALVSLVRQRMTDIDVTLVVGATIRGRVLGADQQPVFRARIRCLSAGGPPLEIPTAPDGSFALCSFSRGPVRLSAIHRRGGMRVRPGLHVPKTGIDVGDLVLQAGTDVISGRVLDQTGRPVAGVRVGAYDPRSPEREWDEWIADSTYVADVIATTDYLGHFRLAVPDAETNWALGLDLNGEIELSDDVRAGATDVELRVRHRLHWIRIETASGQPVPNAQIELVEQPGGTDDMYSGLRTDVAGRVGLVTDSTASWRIDAFSTEHGRVTRVVKFATDKPQSHVVVRFGQEPNHRRVTIRVVDKEDVSVGRVYVECHTPGGMSIFETHWQSFPQQLSLPPGKYKLFIMPFANAMIAGEERSIFDSISTSLVVSATQETTKTIQAKGVGFIRLATKGDAVKRRPADQESINLGDAGRLSRGGFKLNTPVLLNKGVAPGRYTMTWRHRRYKTVTFSFEVRVGQVTDIAFEITPK